MISKIRILRRIQLLIFSTVGTLLLCTCSYAEKHDTGSLSLQTDVCSTKLYSYKVINVYPHDANSFTQGLVYDKGFLYEGTGLRGKSSLRKVELETGKVLQIRNLPDRFFGEGITLHDNKIIQLTWNSGIGFIYDRDSFEPIDSFTYPNQGWGITHDGERLITSDGTSIIRYRKLQSFREIGQIQVRDHNGPVENLNELEYINGQIYANVWKTDRIAVIAPETGKVAGWIDLQGLYVPVGPLKPVDALNGIAYDSENDRLFVTGKLWPKLYEIEIKEAVK